MTRTEWDALPMRERDACVAEKIMGWTVVTEDEEQPDQVPYLIGPPHGPDGFHDVYYPKVAAAYPDVYPASFLPPFSTSWDAMRAVVEKLRADGWWWSLCNLMDTPGMEWRAELRDPRRLWDADGHHLAAAPTAPEAVSIAALTALGHMDGAA